MKFHALLAKALADQGTDTLFGLLADPTMQFADSFVRDQGGTFVSAVHEAGATHMAYGYAVISGRLGVVSVDHGPGLTNSLTAVIDAVKSRTPMLMIYPDTVVEDKHYRQSVPHRELIIPTGAGFEQARTPHTVVMDMAVAIRRAHYERRPIALNVPREFLAVDVDYVPVNLQPTPRAASKLDDAALDTALGIIATARRPVVVAGRGAIGARAELLLLAERVGAPVATSLGGKDLFRGDPFELGIMGTLSGGVGLEILAEADCLIVFGAGLNPDTSVKGSILAGKRVVHCDVDPERLVHFNEVDAMIVGDAAEVATTIIDGLDGGEIAPATFRSDAMAERLRAWRAEPLPERPTKPGYVDVYRALHHIDAAVPANRIYVNDPGRHASVSWPGVRVEDPRDFVLTAHFGAIGTGMAVAIGAGCADRSRPVLLVGGDGAFMLGGLNEFNSAVRHGIDLIVVLCNDGSYGPEHMMLVQWGFSPEIVEFDWPDFGPVATALGGEGITVRDEDDLDAVCKLIANRTRPVLIDLRLDPYAMPGIPH